MTHGKHAWALRARLSGRKRVTVYSGKHAISVGPPLAFSDRESLPTALELVLAALAADVIGGFEAACRRRRLRIDSAEVALTATCEEPLAHIGVRGVEGSPRLDRGSLTLYVGSDEEESDILDAWHETLARAPVVETLKTSMDLEMKLRLN